MLVLSRRIGEAIVLPENDVVIRVLNQRGSTIRLGITAPPRVAVHREEVWRKIFGRCAPPPTDLVADDGGFDVPVLPR